MLDINNMASTEIIKEQYSNTHNLSLRQSLHEKYSVNQKGFSKWMFEQYQFAPKIKVLELGSGKGDLWEAYFAEERLLAYNMEIVISDFSEGMRDYMQNRYRGKRISIRQIDILDIPYEEETFDLVIANSMLYHVKDLDRAIAEVRRVMKKGGLFYASTLGIHGMIEYLYHALDQLKIPYQHGNHISFTLQNGMELLRKQFEQVERHDYEDSLKIDKIEDYLDYIYSMASMSGLDRKYYQALKDYFESKQVDGYLNVPKEYGMFIAKKL